MVEKEKRSLKALFSKEEIALTDLLELFTSRKKIFYTLILIFLAFGVLVVVTTPTEYQSEVKVLSEGAESGSAGSLSSLAGLAGVSLGSSGSVGSAMGPTMYPNIVASRPFLMDLMNEKFFFQEKGKELTLYEYFNQDRPGHVFEKTYQFLKKVPRLLYSVFKKKKSFSNGENSEKVANDSDLKILRISRDQEYVMNELVRKIEIEITGKIVIVRTLMPEPLLSAEINNVVLKKIMKYVISYNTEKLRLNVEYLEERTKEAEQVYKHLQLKLASFQDANRGVISKTALTKELQLTEEYKLAFAIYSKLALEYEQAKIQLKKETPLFTEFQPVSVPIDQAEPDIPVIFAIYFSLGIFFGGLFTLVSIIRSYFVEERELKKMSMIDESMQNSK